MKTLLIGALIATLIGCCRIPPQATLERCTSRGCVQNAAAHHKVKVTPVAIRSGPVAANAKPATVAAVPTSPSNEPADPAGSAEAKANPAVSAAPAVPVTNQPAETSDDVLKKAKTRTAATLVNPLFAEFGDMKRAVRKDMSGQPVDSICGHVKEKKASGEGISD